MIDLLELMCETEDQLMKNKIKPNRGHLKVSMKLEHVKHWIKLVKPKKEAWNMKVKQLTINLHHL